MKGPYRVKHAIQSFYESICRELKGRSGLSGKLQKTVDFSILFLSYAIHSAVSGTLGQSAGKAKDESILLIMRIAHV